LAEVLLYIEMATELAIGCQLEDIHCRCCFVLTGEIYFVEEVVVADIDVVKVLALRVHVPVGECVLLLIVALPALLFLARSASA
jgi:hypothetical protein